MNWFRRLFCTSSPTVDPAVALEAERRHALRQALEDAYDVAHDGDAPGSEIYCMVADGTSVVRGKRKNYVEYQRLRMLNLAYGWRQAGDPEWYEEAGHHFAPGPPGGRAVDITTVADMVEFWASRPANVAPEWTNIH